MAGLFPAVGTAPNNTQNAIVPAVVDGCTPQFYPNNCNPRFDPVATNAIMSELLNAINSTQLYDCTRLDNLKNAIKNSVCGLGVVEPVVDAVIAACVTTNGVHSGQSFDVKKFLQLAPRAFDINSRPLNGAEYIANAREGEGAVRNSLGSVRDWMLPQAPNIFPQINWTQIADWFSVGLGVDAATAAQGAAKTTIQDLAQKILPKAPAIYPTAGGIAGNEYLGACDVNGGAEKIPISMLRDWIAGGIGPAASGLFQINEVGGIASDGNVNTAVANVTWPFCMLMRATGFQDVGGYAGGFNAVINGAIQTYKMYSVRNGVLFGFDGSMLYPIMGVGGTITFTAYFSSVVRTSGGGGGTGELSSMFTRANVRRGQIVAI